jgi:hypothetical protein
MFLATVLAEIAMAAERLGMAGAESAYYFPVMGRQAKNLPQIG